MQESKLLTLKNMVSNCVILFFTLFRLKWVALQEIRSSSCGWSSLGYVQTLDEIMWNSVPYFQRWRSRGSKQGKSVSHPIVGDPDDDHLILYAPFSSMSICSLELCFFVKVQIFLMVGTSWLSLVGPGCGLGDVRASLSTYILVFYDFRFKYLQGDIWLAF